MPYTPIITFINGASVTSTAIRGINKRLRNYLNKEIDIADIGLESVNTAEIVKGEPLILTNDHQFTTGSQYNQFKDGEDINRDYFTGQIKSIDASKNTSWWVLTETGKTITLEQKGRVLVHGGFVIICEENFSMDYDADGAVDQLGLGSEVQLRVDGVNQPITSTMIFEETITTSAAPIPSPAASLSALNKRRWYPISYLTDELDIGEHNIVFVIDSVVDMGYVSSRNITIEVMYT